MDRDDPTRRPITQNFEDEGTFGEQPPEEGEANDWQDPPAEPIDDFADPEQAFAEEQIEGHEGGADLRSSYATEEGAMEEEYAQAEDEFAEGEPSNARANAEQYLPPGMAEKKPASPLMKYLPYGITGIVLIVLGFFGFQQLQSMMNPQDSGPGGAMVAPPLQQNAMANSPDNPIAAENSAHSVDAMPVPAAQTQPQQAVPLGAAPEQQAQAQPPVAATTTTTTTTQGTQYIQNPDGTRSPMTPQVMAQMQQQQQQAQQPAAVNPLEGQLAAVTQQLEDMKKNQAALQDQLQKAQAAQNAPNPEVTSLQSKVSELEQRLATAQAAKPVEVKTTTTVTHKKTSGIAKPSDGNEQDLPAPVSDAKPSKSYAHTRASRKGKTSGDTEASRLQREMNARYGVGSGAANGPMNGMGGGMPMNGNSGPLPTGPYGAAPAPQWGDQGAPMAVQAAGGGWILRSAQPGSAWLSQGMSSDLTRVVPGDKVPGLGTIVSVRMVGGRWLVEGTQGSVR